MRFVLVDRLLSLERGRRVAASFAFPPHLELFEDHFPGQPVVPGTLLTEAMGQAAGWLLVASLEFRRWPLLTSVDQARFFRRVAPGDDIVTHATICAANGRNYDVHAEARVDGVRAARARLLFRAEDFHEAEHRLLEDWGRRTFARLGGEAL